MRENPIKRTLAGGGRVFGTMVAELFAPGMPQILAAAGAEFAIFDTEHSGIGIETIRSQMAAARFTRCVPLVRIGAIEHHAIASVLDAGAFGVMAPVVETAEQAAFLVSCTRYPPMGRRGVAFGVAHDDYEPGPVAAKMAMANARTIVIALIETEAGLANIEAIAAVPGIDVLWMGQYDLTASLGIPGEFDHPRFRDAVRRLLDVAARHGPAAGTAVSDEDAARMAVAAGYRMIAYGPDHQLLQAALTRGLTALRAAP